MNTFFSRTLSVFAPIAALFATAPAWAIEAQAEVPIEPSVSPIWVLVFFALCGGGIYWYVWATNKASKQEKAQQKQAQV